MKATNVLTWANNGLECPIASANEAFIHVELTPEELTFPNKQISTDVKINAFSVLYNWERNSYDLLNEGLETAWELTENERQMIASFVNNAKNLSV